MMNILVADDNAPFRSLLREVLACLRAQIAECESGEDALAACGYSRCDVVLMDLRMKGMDGLSATRAILSQDREAKVFMLTSYDDEELRTAAHAAGACGYALKEDLQGLTRLLRASS